MTSLTSGWESGGNVIRIRDARVIGLVTRVTIRGSTGIFASNVATCAGHGGVCPRQRKRRVGVIKRRWFPDRSTVADGAIEREGRSLVVRSDDVVVVVQVA